MTGEASGIGRVETKVSQLSEELAVNRECLNWLRAEFKDLKGTLKEINHKIDCFDTRCAARGAVCEKRFSNLEVTQGITGTKLAAILGGITMVIGAIIAMVIGVIKELFGK